jgi:hypothetical protein
MLAAEYAIHRKAASVSAWYTGVVNEPNSLLGKFSLGKVPMEAVLEAVIEADTGVRLDSKDPQRLVHLLPFPETNESTE